MDVAAKIWDKYHSYCFGKGKFRSALPCEIVPISNTTLVVFISNFTATHAITYADRNRKICTDGNNLGLCNHPY